MKLYARSLCERLLSSYPDAIQPTQPDSITGDWDGFCRAVDRVPPKFNRTLLLSFPDEDLRINELVPKEQVPT